MSDQPWHSRALRREGRRTRLALTIFALSYVALIAIVLAPKGFLAPAAAQASVFTLR